MYLKTNEIHTDNGRSQESRAESLTIILEQNKPKTGHPKTRHPRLDPFMKMNESPHKVMLACCIHLRSAKKFPQHSFEC